jgi:sugar-specific transcriptional regulator TrmB
LDQESILKALMSLKLSEKDAKVYIFLAKKGPLRSEEIANSLKIGNKQVCLCLRNLQKQGIVNSALEPALFLAVTFDKVIDLLIKNRKQQAKNIQQNKQEILQKWRSTLLDDPNN